MRLEELPGSALLNHLRSGITLRSGPFAVTIRSDIPAFAKTLQLAYGTLSLVDDEVACPHFRVAVLRQRGLRGYFRPQAVFAFEGLRPFDPYPMDQAFPLFEWGLNWVIATTAHQYLLLHSAVVERHGQAVILPATPGSGKSTLCAALVSRGWRLLSDEFGLLNPENRMILPFPRAAPLKNNSIDVIRAYAPDANLGPRFERTRKGTVEHLFPPQDALARQQEAAVPSLIVFPRYNESSQLATRVEAPEKALVRLINNSFNYPVTGSAGFRLLCDLVNRIPAIELKYNDLDDAIGTIDSYLVSAQSAKNDQS